MSTRNCHADVYVGTRWSLTDRIDRTIHAGEFHEGLQRAIHIVADVFQLSDDREDMLGQIHSMQTLTDDRNGAFIECRIAEAFMPFFVL